MVYERRGAFLFDGEPGTSHQDCRSVGSFEVSCALFRFPEVPGTGSGGGAGGMDFDEFVRVSANGLSESSVSLTLFFASTLLGRVEASYCFRSASYSDSLGLLARV